MTKLILFPLSFVTFSQIAWFVFYKVMQMVLDLDPKGDGLGFLKAAYFIVSVVLLVTSAISSYAWLFDGWGPEKGAIEKYEEKKALAAKQREEFLANLDKEVGIPRIPVRR